MFNLETKLIAFHRLYRIVSSLIGAMGRMELLHKVVMAYHSEHKMQGIDPPKDVLDWEDAALVKVLSCPSPLKEEDGAALVRFIKTYPRNKLLKR